jgi:glutathione synthase/RimK-type ligase-like ATP-grasp enzyme
MISYSVWRDLFENFDEENKKYSIGIFCRKNYDKDDDSGKQYCEQDSFFRVLIERGVSLGYRVFVFSELVGDTCVGYIPDGEGWKKINTDIPQCVYVRDPAMPSEKRDALFIKGVKFFNPDPVIDIANNKWKMYNVFKEHPLNLPFTRLWDKNFDIKKISEKFDIFYVKPVNGSMGKCIYSFKKKEDVWYCKYEDTEEKVDDLSDKINKVVETIKESFDDVLIQEGIDVQMYKESVFDVRVLMQKDKNGKNLLTGFNSRCGEPGKNTSNLHTGGYGKKTSEIVEEMYGEEKKNLIIEEIRNISWKVTHILDSISPFGEVGIDLLIDKKGKIYLIEINTRPGRSLFKIEKDIRKRSLERPIEYCGFLAKC